MFVGEQPGKRLAGPEFDVAMEPEGGVMLVPLVQEGEDEVLEVTVVGRGDEHDATGLEQ